jgi:hypothetical protein
MTINFLKCFSVVIRTLYIRAVTRDNFLKRLAALVRSLTAENGDSTTLVEVSPAFLGKVIEGKHPFPVPLKRFHGLWIVGPEPLLEPLLQPLAFAPYLSIEDFAYAFACLRLNFFRKFVQNIGNLVVPAPLFPSPHPPALSPYSPPFLLYHT